MDDQSRIGLSLRDSVVCEEMRELDFVRNSIRNVSNTGVCFPVGIVERITMTYIMIIMAASDTYFLFSFFWMVKYLFPNCKNISCVISRNGHLQQSLKLTLFRTWKNFRKTSKDLIL
jgi:hypothetical protein